MKGSHDSRTPDFKKRRDNFDKIKGAKKPKGFETVKPGKVRKVYK
jgi:hypothetical protein